MKIVAALLAHDDASYISNSIECPRLFIKSISNITSTHSKLSSSSKIPLFLFLSRLPWHGRAGDWQAAAAVAESLGLTTIIGDWNSELAQRQVAIEHLTSLGFTHALIPDTDEIIEPQLLQTLLKIAENELADRVYVHWDTYWKSPQYVIRPREPFTPCYLIDLRVAKSVGGRNFEGGRPLLLGPEYGIVHHLSWVGPQRRIDRKTETWGHAKEVLPGWKDRVWKAWDSDKTLRNLHPTHPQAYGFAERIALPGDPKARLGAIAVGDIGEVDVAAGGTISKKLDAPPDIERGEWHSPSSARAVRREAPYRPASQRSSLSRWERYRR